MDLSFDDEFAGCCIECPDDVLSGCCENYLSARLERVDKRFCPMLFSMSDRCGGRIGGWTNSLALLESRVPKLLELGGGFGIYVMISTNVSRLAYICIAPCIRRCECACEAVECGRKANQCWKTIEEPHYGKLECCAESGMHFSNPRGKFLLHQDFGYQDETLNS